MKSVKVEFELSNIGAKFTAIQREKDALLSERDALRETCDELVNISKKSDFVVYKIS